MKQSLSPTMVAASLVVTVLLVGLVVWKLLGSTGDGVSAPPPEVANMTREDMIRQRNAPPPPGPPLPSADARPGG